MSQVKAGAEKAQEIQMKVYDPSTMDATPRSSPKINVGKTGSFRLNQAMIRLLNLKAGDEVSFSKDQQANWYVFKNKGGFALRESKDALTFNSSALVSEIGVNGSFLIAGRSTKIGKVEYWGILIPE